MVGARLLCIALLAARATALGPRRALLEKQFGHLDALAVGRAGEEITLRLDLPERQAPVEISLVQNVELFAETYAPVVYRQGGQVVQRQRQQRESCHFAGQAAGEAPGTAAFSLCSGKLEGVFLVDGRRLRASASTRASKVTVRQLEAFSAEGGGGPFGNGTDSEAVRPDIGIVDDQAPRPDRTQPPLVKRGSEELYIEVLLISDAQRLEQFGGDTAATIEAAEVVINLVNAIYASFNPIGSARVSLTLAGQAVWTRDYEALTVAANENGHYDAQDTLDDLNSWRARTLDTLPSHDVAHLLSGKELIGPTIGLAYIGSACDQVDACDTLDPGFCYRGEKDGCCVRTGGALVQASRDSEMTARVAAHELGHQLGLEHDTEEAGCDDLPAEGEHGLMEPRLPTLASGYVPILSACSRKAFQAVWQGEATASGFHPFGCLANKPEHGRLDSSLVVLRGDPVHPGEDYASGAARRCTSTWPRLQAAIAVTLSLIVATGCSPG